MSITKKELLHYNRTLEYGEVIHKTFPLGGMSFDGFKENYLNFYPGGVEHIGSNDRFSEIRLICGEAPCIWLVSDHSLENKLTTFGTRDAVIAPRGVGWMISNDEFYEATDKLLSLYIWLRERIIEK